MNNTKYIKIDSHGITWDIELTPYSDLSIVKFEAGFVCMNISPTKVIEDITELIEQYMVKSYENKY